MSHELIERYDIDILPLYIVLGDQEYADGEGISPDEIFRWSDASNQTPKTAAISIERAAETFRKYIDQGDEIICFSISIIEAIPVFIFLSIASTRSFSVSDRVGDSPVVPHMTTARIPASNCFFSSCSIMG